MKKVFLFLVLVVLISSLLIGCQPPATSTPTQTGTTPPKTTPTTTAAKPPIKIGLLYELTGPMAMTGKRMLDANKLSFEQAGMEVAGRKIEIITGDSGSQPQMALDTARKMVENDKVSLVMGPIMGNLKIAVADYMTKAGVPHLNTSPAPVPVLLPQMVWSIAGAGGENQYSTAAGKYAVEKMGFKTISLMTEDLEHAHGFAAGFQAAFESGGGKVIQQQFTPYPANDFASYIANVKDANALAAWYEGSDAIMFLNQVHDLGLRKRMPVYAAFFGSFFANFILNELKPAAAEATLGEITCTPYAPSIDNPVNKAFVTLFKQKNNGALPDDTDATPYDGGLIVLEALKKNNGDTNPAALKDAILKVEIMGTEGPIKFDTQTRCRIRDVYVCKVDKQDGKYLWTPIFTYKDVPPFGFAPPPGPPPGK